MKKRTGRPATGWVKVAGKVSAEVKALLDDVPKGQKSKAIDDALRVYFGIEKKDQQPRG